QPATDESLEVPERTVVETFLNISPENKAHYDAKKEAIHLLLTGIEDEIYSTVNACKTAHDMWIAIKRLQHGKSLNKQDVKTSLFWEFGRFTSRDGESNESYYSRSYAPPAKTSPSTRSHATTRHKGKEIAKPITPPSESASKEDSDPKQAQKDKKPKRVKDSTYHKEKMLLCKQAEKGVPFQVEQSDWLADTDEEIDEQELEAHYSYMEKIQE
ncbi:hypothetical protein Tco_0783827, partial [Tanacetum coccineum]